MIAAILGIFSSAGFGGIIGLAGSVFQHFLKVKEKKADQAHELAMRQEDRKDMVEESRLRVKEATVKVEGQAKIANIEMLAEELQAEEANVGRSYDNDKAAYSKWSGLTGAWGAFAKFMLAMVDVVRGFIRPAITTWGVCTLTWLAYSITQALGGLPALVEKDPAQAWSMLLTVVNAIVFIATTSGVWWFGSRKIRTQSGNGND